MKRFLIPALLLIAGLLVLAACGSGLRNGTYVFSSSNIPREDFSSTENIWVRFSEHENGITVDGNRIRSGGGSWYYFQIVNNAIEVRRNENASWSSTPYRVRGGNLTMEFRDGERVVTLRRR
ncbi:MAG: hypothetical protein FWE44_00710 [Defluviitaleaceae bacterium]|nr:hypothetical protein [Defluviitaleaceae bacterium]